MTPPSDSWFSYDTSVAASGPQCKCNISEVLSEIEVRGIAGEDGAPGDRGLPGPKGEKVCLMSLVMENAMHANLITG